MKIALSARPWSVCLFCLLMVVGAARDISAQPNRPLTAEQILSIREPGDVQISPDGKRVAFVITEPSRPPGFESRPPTNIWLAPTDGSAHETRFEDSSGTETSPRWSPDGRFLAFLSAREPVDHHFQPPQLYVRDIAAGKTRRLSHFVSGVESFRWSPDGTMITLLTSARSSGPVSGAISGGDATVVKNNTSKSLWVIGLASGEAVRVTKEDLEIYDYAWSPNGTEFAMEIASGNTPGVPQHRSLVVLDRLSGTIVRSLSNHVGPSGAIQWSPDGKWVSFFAATPREVPCWLAIVPASGGTVHLFMKDAPGTIVNAIWTPDAQHLLAEMMEGTHQALYRLDVGQDRSERVLELLNMPQFDSAYSAAGNTIAYLNQSPHSPNDVWIAQAGEKKKITDLNPQVASWQLGDVREVSWKSTKDGSAINGVIITPADFQPGHPYPTVVQTHPGWVAWWAGWQGSWWAWGQLLASHGYVVFLPNYRGVWGQGWKWFDAIADWGGMTVPDLLDGVDYLVQQKIADPGRIGIGGWSNGGFVAAAAITQSARFRAAVLDAPLTDLSSCQALPNCAFLRVHLGDPYEQHARYDELSPVTHIRDCHTPTLLLHGAEDDDDPIGQSYEFYYGLKNLNREAEMVVYPREPHNIGEPAHQIDLQNRVLKWFDEHLKNP